MKNQIKNQIQKMNLKNLYPSIVKVEFELYESMGSSKKQNLEHFVDKVYNFMQILSNSDKFSEVIFKDALDRIEKMNSRIVIEL